MILRHPGATLFEATHRKDDQETYAVLPGRRKGHLTVLDCPSVERRDDARRARDLERENALLERAIADAQIDIARLRERLRTREAR